MSSYVAGIDGGQSSTAAVIGDESGRILGRGRAGPADEVAQVGTSTRMRDALRGALDAAIADAGLPAQTFFSAVVAGVSGYEGRILGQAPDLPATRVVLMHDAPIAHAGALAGKPGVIAIAGTGSVVYATDGRHCQTIGGWGHLFGDEGSAFWLVREALARLMRCEDAGDTSHEPERQAACEYFGLASLRAVARAFYGGEITRDALAAFAIEALRFEYFRDLADYGADRLAALVRAAIHAGAHPVVALCGGMFNDGRFGERTKAAIREAGHGVRIVEPAYDPPEGALLLAYREAGIIVTQIGRR